MAWLAAAAGLALVLVAAYRAFIAPIDDPSYFCQVPDPSPVTSIAPTAILGVCAAGKTFTLVKGQTIAVDLWGGYGVDTSTEWTDLAVSDPHVLSAVSAPARVGVARQRIDEVAAYRAAQSGQATLSAVEQWCTANLTCRCSCRQGHLWSVSIRVS
jgi:hypothetical protein